MKYFHNIFFSLLFILFCSEVLSQKITIMDSTSDRPIRGVLVFNSEKTTRVVSNKNGLVNLNKFIAYETRDLFSLKHQLTEFPDYS